MIGTPHGKAANMAREIGRENVPGCDLPGVGNGLPPEHKQVKPDPHGNRAARRLAKKRGIEALLEPKVNLDE